MDVQRHASIVHGLMLTDEMDQQAPISKSNGNSDKGKKQRMYFQIIMIEKHSVKHTCTQGLCSAHDRTTSISCNKWN